MAYAFVQQAQGVALSSGTTVASSSLTVTAGNLLIVVVFAGSSGTISIPTDPRGNAFTQGGDSPGIGDSGVRYAWFYCLNANGGAGAISASTTQAAPIRAIYVAEFSGVDLFIDDNFGYQVTPTTTTDAVSSGNANVSTQPALLFATSFNGEGISAPNAGTGFTSLTGVWDAGGGATMRPEHRRVTATGNAAATFTATSNTSHYTVAIAFRETVTAATLTVNSATHGHSADNASLAVSGTLSVSSATHAHSASGPTLRTFLGRFPTAVSSNGRYINDQNGDPWPVLGDANIVIHHVPKTDIEDYLDQLVAHGFNAVWWKLVYASSGGMLYQDMDGNAPFTGTIFQSSLNSSYWDNVEWILSRAGERGITCILFPTWAGNNDSEGDRVEMEAASGAQMQAYGAAVGARLKDYPNIIWMNGGDRPSPGATLVSRWGSVATGIVGAGASQLWGLQGTRGVLQSTYIAAGSMGAQPFDLNTMYQDAADPVGDAAAAWAENIGPVIAYEMIYENEYSITLDRLRLQYWGTFCAGAIGHVYGNRPRWHMDTAAAYAVPGVSYAETWDDPDGDDDRGTDDFAKFAAFIDGIAWAGMSPDTTDTFLTAGEGSGVTRSAARFDGTATSGVVAVAYRAHGGSASLTFDLTELAPPSVKVRKLDPISGAYTDIGTYSTSGSQSVGSLGSNSAGDSDWALVFEAAAAAIDLTVSNAGHGHSVGSPSLIQGHMLTASDAAHAHSAESISLSQALSLIVSEALHAHTGESISLSQASTLAIAGSIHGHTVDAVDLIQSHLLAVQDTSHAHVVDGIALMEGLALVIGDSLHGHSSDSAVLVQAHILSVEGSNHSHTVESVSLSEGLLLDLADALHGHTAESVVLTQGSLLAVASALHLHASGMIDLSQAGMLVVGDAVHSHLADALDLRLPSSIITPAVRTIMVWR